jgi:hypothetical protein
MAKKQSAPTFSDETRAISALKAHPLNVRMHPERQIAALGRNMRKFGFTQPILIVEDGTIVAGHARLEAAESIGIESVPVRVVRGWSAGEVRAYMLADNRLAELAGWDESGLRRELEAISGLDMDLADLGWSDDEVNRLMGDAPAEFEDGFSDTERTASGMAMVRVGPYRFEVEIEALDNWITGIRGKVGDTEDQICGEIRKRLGLPK